MAETPLGRRRAASSASRQGHMRTQSRAVPQPKSSYTSDDFLKEFLNPSFDPASYLNAVLPPLARRHNLTATDDAIPLAELSAQAQTLTSQLNAHTTRLSNTLTQLTDDILRSGSRLAYKVELLRGETLSLTEALNEKLQEDIKTFVPDGLQGSQDGAGAGAGAGTKALEEGEKVDLSATDVVKVSPSSSSLQLQAQHLQHATGPEDPDFIQKLQTLTVVRSRLDSVIKTFGDAMEFVFPPSEISVGSGFLSVSAPEPGSEQQSSEAKGQEVLQGLRNEISNLLARTTADPVDAISRAVSRIEQLKELAVVWKGTAEEHGRAKFIDGLAKMVEDRHRELTRELEQTVRREAKPAGATHARKGSSVREMGMEEEGRGLPGGFGLINQLQRLRTGLN